MSGSPSMACQTIYTRTYSNNSAGGTTAAKATKGKLLTETILLEEFRNHVDLANREPTALISCSDRIVDTLKRAFSKHFHHGEAFADIWIVFIEVPLKTQSNAVRIHSAEELAEKCNLPEPRLFAHELIFEFAIPEEYLLHKVSLQTLLARGLRADEFCQFSTKAVRRYFGSKLSSRDPWEVGLELGCFARTFGARSPLDWISEQLFRDCTWTKIVDDDVVRLRYVHGHTEIVDFHFFRNLRDGISTSLYDWWLTDIDFIVDYEAFTEQRDEAEDGMIEDVTGCWATWHDDGRIKYLSAADERSHDAERNKMLIKHEKRRARIEEEAVKIGL